MVAYSFQKRFAAPILTGAKAQTIRGARKRHARPGELLQLFTGMRTKHCRRLGVARCTAVHGVVILLPRRLQRAAIVFSPERDDGASPMVSDGIGLDAFAHRDGFRDFEEMAAFWREQHPGVDTFHGTLIHWERFEPASPDLEPFV